MRVRLQVLNYKEERDVPGFKQWPRDCKVITWKMSKSTSGEIPSRQDKELQNCRESQKFQMEARQSKNHNLQWSFGIVCSPVRIDTNSNDCVFTFYLHDMAEHLKRKPPPSAQVARKSTSSWHRLRLPKVLRDVALEFLVKFGNSFMLFRDICRREDIICGDEAYQQFVKTIRIPAAFCNQLVNTSKDQVQVTVYAVNDDVDWSAYCGSVVAPLKSSVSNWDVFLAKEGTDVTILANGGELIECHATYISRNSPVLSKLFFPIYFHTDFKQAALVELLDLTRIQVEAFLRYQYNENADKTLEAPEISLGLLKVAERFEIRTLWSDTMKTLLEKNSDWFQANITQELVDYLGMCSKREEEATLILIRKLSPEQLNGHKEIASGIVYRKKIGENPDTAGNAEGWMLVTKLEPSRCEELGKMLESQWTSLSLLKITLSEGYNDIREDIITALIVKDSDWFEGDFVLELKKLFKSLSRYRDVIILEQAHILEQTQRLRKRLSLVLKEHKKCMKGTSEAAKQVVTNETGRKEKRRKFQNFMWEDDWPGNHTKELTKMLESKSTSLSLLKVALSYQNEEMWNEIVTALLVKDSDWFEGESGLELTNFLREYSEPGDEPTWTLVQKITQESISQSVEEVPGNGVDGENENNYESNEHIEDLPDAIENDTESGRQNLDAMKQKGIESLAKMLDSKSNSVYLLEVAQGFQNDEMWKNVIEGLLGKDCDWFEKDLALELMNLLQTCPKRDEETTLRLSTKLSQLLEQPSTIEETVEHSEQAEQNGTIDQDKQNGYSRNRAPKRRKRKAVSEEQLPKDDSGSATAGDLPKSAAVNVNPRRSARLRGKTDGFGMEDESGKIESKLSKQRKGFVWSTAKKFYGPRDIRKDPVLPKVAIIPDPAVKVEKVEPLQEETEDSARMYAAGLQIHVAQEQDYLATQEMAHMDESSVNNDDDVDYQVIKLDLEEDD